LCAGTGHAFDLRTKGKGVRKGRSIKIREDVGGKGPQSGTGGREEKPQFSDRKLAPIIVSQEKEKFPICPGIWEA